MVKSKLELSFKDVVGKKFNLSLDQPRGDLTQLEVKEAMDEIVDRNIFITKEGDLVESLGARIITTTIEELTI